MRNRYARTLLPALALLLALDITVTAGMLSNANTLDIMFGRQTQLAAKEDSSAKADYYIQEYNSQTEAYAAAKAVSKQISDEGIVLLKNDGLLPLNIETTISPFGLRCFDPYYCGTGSSQINTGDEAVISPIEGLSQAFASLNNALAEAQLSVLQRYPDISQNPQIHTCYPVAALENRDVLTLSEFDTSVYQGLEASCTNTVAVVYIGRQTGENTDACTMEYDDGTPHMLAITSAERKVLQYAKQYCAGVVVAICSASPMQIAELEDDPGINAVLWIGGAGSTGYLSFAEILTGAVNPSGRTAVSFPADFQEDPSFANYDNGTDSFVYQNAATTYISNTAVQENTNAAFQEFEEGIYVGYKYYETAFDMGYLASYYNRKNGIVYPFGYGLSYTQFSQRIIRYQTLGAQITLDVAVRNEGSVTGKDVVQIYAAAPYTALDQEYAIEKSTAELLAFAKTALLAPGGETVVTLSFSTEDIASYCYTHRNADLTTGCYMLEAGLYTLSLRRNSHEIIESVEYRQNGTVWFSNTNPRQSEINSQSHTNLASIDSFPTQGDGNYLAATNQFEQISRYMTDPSISSAVILSRKDWTATQPSAPTDADRTASNGVIQAVSSSDTTKFDYQDDERLGNQPSSRLFAQAYPVSNAETGLVLADMRGVNYEDPSWDLILNQLDYRDSKSIQRCLFEAAYQTGELRKISKPATVEYDGPQGFTLSNSQGKVWLKNMYGYPAAPVMAATWNLELLYAFGYMVGQEALTADINGWYAPGLNIARSPFCGRASEYYSEDPVLSGWIGAQILSGAGEVGLSCAMKHFAIMTSEAHRSPHTITWMTEQTLREVYLKPFEIAVKNAQETISYTQSKNDDTLLHKTMRAADFIMASDSAIGTEWCAANYSLLETVLRGEWGFQGTVISDMHLNVNGSVAEKLLRSGCDLLMSIPGNSAPNIQDYTSSTIQWRLRAAIKNLCYMYANSNLMQGIPPATIFISYPSPWKLWLIIMNVFVLIMIIIGVALLIRKRNRLKRQ